VTTARAYGLPGVRKKLDDDESTGNHPLNLFFRFRSASMMALLGVSFVDDVALLF